MPASPFTSSDHPTDDSTLATNDLIIKLHTPPVTSTILSKTSVTSETDTHSAQSSSPVDCKSPESQAHEHSSQREIDSSSKFTPSPSSPKSINDDTRTVSPTHPTVLSPGKEQLTTATSMHSSSSSSSSQVDDHSKLNDLKDDPLDLSERDEKKVKDPSNLRDEMKSHIETAVHASGLSAAVLASTPPDSTVTHCAGRVLHSSATSVPENKVKQIEQLQRFLTTLQSFASDLSPEIGHAIRSLVIALSVSEVLTFSFAAQAEL